jgi:glycosyltransferase involved in cell wall biosynthesis
MPGADQILSVQIRSGTVARYLGSTYARLQGRVGRGVTSLSEFEFRMNRKWRRPDASHLLHVENNFELLRVWPGEHKDVIGTLHLPQSVWEGEQCELLKRIGSAIALYQRDIPFFEKFVGRGRVRFIHHGADIEFFKPDATKLAASPRILYSGVYLRNEDMLARVAKRLLEKIPALRFDLLVPRHRRANPALAPLLNHAAVTWHSSLNDEQLRALYQQSYLMFLPLNDSGANSSVVEAMSCGLPVATTDVGGIRDYGGGDIFPIVANNDDDAMISMIERYCSKPDWRHEVARSCRKFAEQILAWPLVARKHAEIYRELVA